MVQYVVKVWPHCLSGFIKVIALVLGPGGLRNSRFNLYKYDSLQFLTPDSLAHSDQNGVYKPKTKAEEAEEVIEDKGEICR